MVWNESKGGKERFLFVCFVDFNVCLSCSGSNNIIGVIEGFVSEEPGVTGIEFPYPFIPVKSSAVPSAGKTGLEYDHPVLVTQEYFLWGCVKTVIFLSASPSVRARGV